MKILIDVNENKAAFVLELLQSLSFVKSKQISKDKAEIIEGIKEGMEEMILMEKSQLQGYSAKSLRDEI